MRAPFSFTGAFRVDDPTLTLPRAVASIEQALRKAEVVQLQTGRDSVAFRGGGRSWSAGWTIGPVSSAEITFTQTPSGIAVHYRWAAFDNYAVAVVAVLLLGPLSLSGILDIPLAPYIVLLLFSLFAGATRYFCARERFPRFLAETLGIRTTLAPLAHHIGEPFPDY